MGYLYALAAFACIGSYLVPVRFSTAKGISFLPLMGLGMLLLELFRWGSIGALWIHPLWFWGSLVSGFLWVLGQGFGNLALEEISLAKAAAFYNTNTFINMGLGLALFKEASGWRSYLLLLAGGCLLFTGALWVSRAAAVPAKEKNLKRGIWLSLCAGFFWGIYFVPVKALQVFSPEPSLSSLDVLTGLVLGGGIPALGLGLFQNRRIWTLRNVGWGVVCAFLWNVGTFFFLMAIQTLGLSRAVPVVNSNSLVYAAWSFFVFKELPLSQGGKVLGGTLLAILGIIFLACSA